MGETRFTEALGEWASQSKPDWSKTVFERAHHAMTDGFSSMVAGAADKGAALLRAIAIPYGEGSVSIIGSRRQAPALWAALVNGYASHAVEMDDNFHPGLAHATASIAPAIWALGEEIGATGADVIDAYIVGTEVMARIGLGIGLPHSAKGWHPTSTIGSIAAAAACGRLLKLDVNAMINAISIACSMSAGSKGQFGTMTKPLHPGLAAKSGILAARLAQGGIEASHTLIEGEKGFGVLYSGETRPDWSVGMRDNEPLALEKWGLAVKLYPCCGSTHRIIDCVIELRNEHGFTADQVVAVETLIGYNNMKNLPFGQPKNEMEARFSMQYCVAVALLNGALMLSDFTQEGVDRPEVRALLPITTVSAHPLEADSADPTKRLPHTARIRLKNGRVLERSTQWAKGTIHNPFNDADRTAKYMSCCSRFFSEDEVSVVKYKLDNFHELSNVEKLMAHLRKDID
jgi:2-methylcitrate dehydratase PrpD